MGNTTQLILDKEENKISYDSIKDCINIET